MLIKANEFPPLAFGTFQGSALAATRVLDKVEKRHVTATMNSY
jgi:hypothetical protein